MIIHVAYGALLAIGFHIGGKVSDRWGLGPKDRNRIKVYKHRGEGRNTGEHVAKFYGML